MNRKLIGSLAAIALLLGYILISNQKGTRDVPELETWEGKVTSLSIKKGESLVSLEKKDGKWIVGKEEYPADEMKVNNLIKKVKELKLTDLISRQKYYHNYDLTPEKAGVITLSQKDKVVRKLTIGKTGKSGRHTFLLVDEHPEVYQGAVSFQTEFKNSVNDFRDKVIMKVSKEAVTSFSVKYRGRNFVFNRETIKEEKKKETPDLKKALVSKPKVKWICKGFEKVSLNKGRVEGLLASMNPLLASSFPEVNKESLGVPVATVTLKAFNRELDVKIYRQQKDKKYSAVSSESPYVFTLDEWKVKKYFIENLKDLKDNK